MTGVIAKFVLVKLSPLVMTDFFGQKVSTIISCHRDLASHFSLLFNMVYHVVDFVLWFPSDYQTSDSDCGEM